VESSYSTTGTLKTVQSGKICHGTLLDKEEVHISVATLLVAWAWIKYLTSSPTTISHTLPLSSSDGTIEISR
jgi:hypothetical protein